MFSAVIRTQARSLTLKTPSLSSTQTRSLSSLLSSQSGVQQCSLRTWRSTKTNARAFSAGIPRQEESAPPAGDSAPRRPGKSSVAPLFYKKPTNPSKTVYIGNLPYSIDENEVHRMFSQFGEVEDIRLGTDADGRLKGYAHIDYATQEAATSVVDAQLADPAFINGRQLRIDYAPSRTQTANPPHTNLFIGDFRGTQEDLHKAFDQFSEHIMATRMLRDRATGRLTGQCFVEFNSVENATQAMEKLNQTVTPGGYKLSLSYARKKNPSRR